MDAWEILTGNSTLTPTEDYDAWEHLNAQRVGTVFELSADATLVANVITMDATVSAVTIVAQVDE